MRLNGAFWLAPPLASAVAIRVFNCAATLLVTCLTLGVREHATKPHTFVRYICRFRAFAGLGVDSFLAPYVGERRAAIAIAAILFLRPLVFTIPPLRVNDISDRNLVGVLLVPAILATHRVHAILEVNVDLGFGGARDNVTVVMLDTALLKLFGVHPLVQRSPKLRHFGVDPTVSSHDPMFWNPFLLIAVDLATEPAAALEAALDAQAQRGVVVLVDSIRVELDRVRELDFFRRYPIDMKSSLQITPRDTSQ